ncbi:unnamed protein product [Cuscuta campestris]|uniref:CCHC-type domain-containing protein n=1 Tax=Cuscuta campestris TaxID=132261 RepID=A0A484M3K7_9ASTE|nr:unnamed protein product [Cuscuta campestris]
MENQPRQQAAPERIPAVRQKVEEKGSHVRGRSGFRAPSTVDPSRNPRDPTGEITFKIPRNIKFVPSDADSLVNTSFDQSMDTLKRDAWFTLMSDNNHNLTLRSILDKDKLNGSNFLDWQTNLVIVLQLEKKECVLKRAIPPVPAANASRAIKDTYEKHVDDDNQVACLMLAMMTSDLQEHHESMKAWKPRCKMIGYVQTLEKLGFELETELATDLILQSLPELYKQFVVNYEMHELDKPLPELLKMLQTTEESLTKGKGNSLLLVQGGKGKKKFKKAKKNGPKGKGNTEPKSNSSKLKAKGGVAKDSICHHCGEVGHWKRNCKQYLATKKKGEASASALSRHPSLEYKESYLLFGRDLSALVVVIVLPCIPLVPQEFGIHPFRGGVAVNFRLLDAIPVSLVGLVVGGVVLQLRHC